MEFEFISGGFGFLSDLNIDFYWLKINIMFFCRFALRNCTHLEVYIIYNLILIMRLKI